MERGFSRAVALARGVLLGSVVALSACIIPTQLTREAAQSNLPPTVSSDGTTPKFGPLGPYKDTDRISGVTIAADDPDLADQLTARFFVQRPGEARIFTGHEIDRFDFPQSPDNDHPFRRYGTLPIDLQCAAFASADVRSEVYIVVADRPFLNDANQLDKAQAGGFTDENHWEVTCQ